MSVAVEVLMLLLVGSKAIKYHFPDFKREPKDTDYFVDRWWTKEEPGVEGFFHPAIVDYFVNHGGTIGIASPDELYTIKVSHAFWDLKNSSWEKHMFDTAFLKSKGAVLIPELYDVLYAVWEERYGAKKANLNATPEEFFKNTVARIYDHDSIHATVAYYDEPLFNRILRDGEGVAVSRAKFEDLSFEDKLRLVREECYATALERQVIPSDYTYSPRAAYAWALRKTITSFSKGWFPLFIVNNYALLRQPDVDYVAKHKQNSDRLIRLED